MGHFGKYQSVTVGLLLWAALTTAHAQTQTQQNLWPAKPQFSDNNGAPLAGGTASFYVPNTLTPKITYADPYGTTANPTSVPLDAGGRAPVFGSGLYRMILQDVNSSTVYDGLTGTPFPPATQIFVGGTSTGSANAQIVASTSFALTAGSHIVFIAGSSNTGPTTLNVNSTGATNVSRASPNGPQALTGGEIVAGNIVEAVYDGAQYQLLSNPNPNGGFGPQVILASAATSDLGTAPSHNVLLTGTATVSSFGASASGTFPFYRILFNNTGLQLVNSGNLLLPGSANITTTASDTAVAAYYGGGVWQIVSYQRVSGASVVPSAALCGASSLKIVNDSGSPSSVIDITANSAVMANPTSNANVYRASVSVSLNITTGTSGTSTANGMDGAAIGANNFVNAWLIDNGTTTAALGSPSTTAPVLPAGYMYQCRLGAMKVDGSSNLYRTLQTGATTQYQVVATTNTPNLPLVTSASVGSSCSSTTPTYSTSTIRGTGGATPIWVPSTATDAQIVVSLGAISNGATAVASNAAYGGAGSITNPAAIGIFRSPTPNTSTAANGWVKLEANTIAICNSSGAVFLQAWKDSVNAN
jgi:hypothetical protein